jgi:predicted DCC family thiol-disulfide oxidoreductase YuxK
MHSTISNFKTVILFDAECGLCSGAIKFVLKYDKYEKIQFCALNSKSASELLQKVNSKISYNDSFTVIKNEIVYQKSKGVEQVLELLNGWPYYINFVFKICPRVVKDAIYSSIAKNRHFISSRPKTCPSSYKTHRHRFI